MEKKLKPCLYCDDCWLFVGRSPLYPYRFLGWKTNCHCGRAWKPADKWFNTKEEAINNWNNREFNEVRVYEKGIMDLPSAEMVWLD